MFLREDEEQVQSGYIVDCSLPDRSLSYKTRSRRIIRVVSTIKLYAVKN